MIVLSLCDRTANMVRPWAAAGFLCYCVDLQHAPGERRVGNIVYVGADVLDYLPPRDEYAAAFAFAPCTNTATSGARWFKDKGLAGLAWSLPIVERCRRVCEWTGAPWLLEHPVSTLSTYWREPDHTFDPCDFGGYLSPLADAYTKKTCLWTGGGFVMPADRWVEPVEGSKMHLLPPSDDRANLRSATPMGFAEAVFQANAPVHQEPPR